MKKEREFARVIVTKKGERWLDTGHPWCYGSDVADTFGEYENGDLVDVIGPKNKYLGTGFVNDNSKIRVRTINRDASVTIDEDFWYRRLFPRGDSRQIQRCSGKPDPDDGHGKDEGCSLQNSL